MSKDKKEVIRRDRARRYRLTRYRDDRTHAEMALEYLSIFGSLTDGEARNAFGCSRLASVIFRLREKGYPIIKEFEDGNRFCTYKFSLEDDEEGKNK